MEKGHQAIRLKILEANSQTLSIINHEALNDPILLWMTTRNKIEVHEANPILLKLKPLALMLNSLYHQQPSVEFQVMMSKGKKQNSSNENSYRYNVPLEDNVTYIEKGFRLYTKDQAENRTEKIASQLATQLQQSTLISNLLFNKKEETAKNIRNGLPWADIKKFIS